MSLPTAQAFAWSLATTLMTCIVLFRTAEGYAVMPETEFDGDAAAVIQTYDPHER